MKKIYGLIYHGTFFPPELNRTLIENYLEGKELKDIFLYNVSGSWALSSSDGIIFIEDKNDYPEYFI